jgi:hypothetical protein
MDIHTLFNKLLLIVTGSLILISCGKDQQTPPTNLNSEPVVLTPEPILPPNTPSESQTGYLLDSAVQGINYSNSNGTQNRTGADGSFTYFPGDLLKFSIGNIIIGEYQIEAASPGDEYVIYGPFPLNITPVTLTPEAKDNDDQRVINRLILLQTLDDDGDPENGITISDEIHTATANTVLNFDLPVTEFINGDLSTLVKELNDKQLFSNNSPRKIRSEIDALRHFGNLNISNDNLGTTTTIYNSWWRETNGCSGIGESQITIKNKSITFCPNTSAMDGCYDGVIRANGDILLPEMKMNAKCAGLDPNDLWYINNNCGAAEMGIIHADLQYADDKISGSYEASCNNSAQQISADFIKTKSEGGYSFVDLYSEIANIESTVDDIIQSGHCSVDNDCETFILRDRVNCSFPVYKAYAPGTVDMDALLFNQYIFNELKRFDEDGSVSGLHICTIIPIPSTQCINNSCQLVTN